MESSGEYVVEIDPFELRDFSETMEPTDTMILVETSYEFFQEEEDVGQAAGYAADIESISFNGKNMALTQFSTSDMNVIRRKVDQAVEALFISDGENERDLEWAESEYDYDRRME